MIKMKINGIGPGVYPLRIIIASIMEKKSNIDDFDIPRLEKPLTRYKSIPGSPISISCANRRWREAHREHVNQLKAEWRLAHPERVKAHNEHSKARRMAFIAFRNLFNEEAIA